MSAQALAESKAAAARERELEVAKLRAAQTRASDRRSEVDELRARRSACFPFVYLLHMYSAASAVSWVEQPQVGSLSGTRVHC